MLLLFFFCQHQQRVTFCVNYYFAAHTYFYLLLNIIIRECEIFFLKTIPTKYFLNGYWNVEELTKTTRSRQRSPKTAAIIFNFKRFFFYNITISVESLQTRLLRHYAYLRIRKSLLGNSKNDLNEVYS